MRKKKKQLLLKALLPDNLDRNAIFVSLDECGKILSSLQAENIKSNLVLEH